ncbi:hypothetical protein J2T12_005463 [Paenibacillus anaericanus]|uniref:hypothetical protein n=1 Tax=Paenibacillus anaericanus TaxID=170367 RepID=UPI002782BF37|nr:hypothetical protein [Paenibacillus anaericanus]MDQ0092019.1 hypothetical protein [Paenibacillus anaericanus]
MGRKPIVRIEEFSGIKAATFRVDGIDPEDKAFSMLREWAIGALSDYAARRCIGYAPMGHHPEGEDCDSHEYVAQMFLYEHEIDENMVGYMVLRLITPHRDYILWEMSY